MITFKSKLLNATLAASFAIPLATTGMFTSAGSAQAATLVGDFSFHGDKNATLKTNSLTFNTPNTFTIDTSLSTGNFTPFTQGTIGNILSFSPTVATNPFLDLGTNTGTSNDGFDTYTVTSAGYELTALSNNSVAISVITNGFFTSKSGDISKGQGTFTLQAKGTLAQVTTNLNSSKGVTATYSGLYFTSVPEPAALLGLGAVGAVMAMSRRRKSFAQ